MTFQTTLINGVLATLGALLMPTLASATPVGLIHYWTADGTTTDSIGGAATTLVNGASYGAGLEGQAFLFDGVNDRVEAAVNISPSALPAITIGGWFNLSGTAGLDWGLSQDNGGYDRALILNDSRFGTGVAAGVGRTYTSTLPTISLNEWHFMAVAYQGNGLAATVYLDGVAQVVSNVNNSDGLNFFTIGGLYSYSNHEMQGLADNIFIFDRALSVAELGDIQRNGVLPEPASLALVGLGLTALALRRRRTAA